MGQGGQAVNDKPKIIPSLSFAAYCDMDAVNVSKLLTLAKQTPAAAYYEMTHPEDDTTSLAKGHATHAAILEPKVFESLYACMPLCGDFRTKAARQLRDAWLAVNGNKIILTPEENAATLAMRDAVLGNPFLKEFFSGAGQNELTLTWTDKATGLKCKARLDRLTEAYAYQTLLDFKTGRNIADYGIEKAQADYGYHIRMAWYSDALAGIHPAEWRAVFVWVCSAPPYECRATELDPDWIEEGRAGCRRLLDLYAQCKASGNWPSYPAGIEVVNLPQWARRYTPQPKGIL